MCENGCMKKMDEFEPVMKRWQKLKSCDIARWDE